MSDSKKNRVVDALIELFPTLRHSPGERMTSVFEIKWVNDECACASTTPRKLQSGRVTHQLSLPPDWLDTVYAEGIGRVNEMLVLSAKRLPPLVYVPEATV